MLKYIIVKKGFFESAIVFPAGISHDSFLPSFGVNIVSAGFIEDGKCGGRSESLNIDSRGDHDQLFVEQILNMDEIP